MSKQGRRTRRGLPPPIVESEDEDSRSEAESDSTSEDAPQQSQMLPPKSAKTPKSQSQSQSQRRRSKVQDSSVQVEKTVYPMEKMIKDGIIYVWIMQHKKLPLKRSDFLKHVMNGQTRDYHEFCITLEDILDEVFGIQLIPISPGNDSYGNESSMNATSLTPQSNSYAYCIAVSKFRNKFVTLAMEIDEASASLQGLLYLLLTSIFMLRGSASEGMIFATKNLQINSFSIALIEIQCRIHSVIHVILTSDFMAHLRKNGIKFS